MMKRIKAGILAALGMILWPLSGSHASDVSISTTFAFESEYVFRGAQLADESFQPSVEVSYEGFYLGTWVSSPMIDPGAQFLNEVDIYGGYGIEVSDTISLDVGLTYYWYPEEPATASGTKEFFLGVSHGIAFFPDPYLYYDVDLDTFTIEFSKGHSFALDGEDGALTFDLGAGLGFVSPKDGDSGIYASGTADFSYSFSDSASLSIGIRFSGIGDELAGGGRTSNAWWGTSFSAGF